MKTQIFRTLVAACLISPFVAPPALFAANATGGVVNFVGSIIEEPCTIQSRSAGIVMSCYRNGTVTTSSASFKTLTATPSNHDVASVSMHYINPEKSLAIVQVSYK